METMREKHGKERELSDHSEESNKEPNPRRPDLILAETVMRQGTRGSPSGTCSIRTRATVSWSRHTASTREIKTLHIYVAQREAAKKASAQDKSEAKFKEAQEQKEEE